MDIVTGSAPAAFQLHRFSMVYSERVRLMVSGPAPSLGINEFGIYDEPGL